MNIFKKKSIEEITSNTKSTTLKKTLGAFDLIMIGLGAIIGTGVLVLTGNVAANFSGPAVTLSYLIAGSICIFVALGYSELATMLPTSGTLYSYSYAAYGEIIAFLVAGLLILELCFGAATVAAGWSSYAIGILNGFDIHIPSFLTSTPSQGGMINLPAVMITGIIGLVLYRGTEDSKTLNSILVYVKIGTLLTFVLIATPYFQLSNWTPFVPFNHNKILSGATILFMAYTGFSGLACLADECKNPEKDLKIGIITSLIITIMLYVIVSAALTGMVPYNLLDNPAPFRTALTQEGLSKSSMMISIGAVSAMTNVLLILIFSLSRLFYVIGRDGTVPKFFCNIHSKYNSPYIGIIIFTVTTMFLSGFVGHSLLGELASTAALLDYIIALSIVLLFRFNHPNMQRPFKCPAIFIIVPITILTCVYLIRQLILDSSNNIGLVLLYWFTLITIIYFIRKLITQKNA